MKTFDITIRYSDMDDQDAVEENLFEMMEDELVSTDQMTSFDDKTELSDLARDDSYDAIYKYLLEEDKDITVEIYETFVKTTRISKLVETLEKSSNKA